LSRSHTLPMVLGKLRARAKESSLLAAAFWGARRVFQMIRFRLISYPFPRDVFSRLTAAAAIEGEDAIILHLCLEGLQRIPDGMDQHGWTLGMIASQTRNPTAIEILIFGNMPEKYAQIKDVTCWEINSMIAPYVEVDNSGTRLVSNYSGILTPFGIEFFPRFGLSVKRNHPFPPRIMGRSYFEVEILECTMEK